MMTTTWIHKMRKSNTKCIVIQLIDTKRALSIFKTRTWTVSVNTAGMKLSASLRESRSEMWKIWRWRPHRCRSCLIVLGTLWGQGRTKTSHTHRDTGMLITKANQTIAEYLILMESIVPLPSHQIVAPKRFRINKIENTIIKSNRAARRQEIIKCHLLKIKSRGTRARNKRVILS